MFCYVRQLPDLLTFVNKQFQNHEMTLILPKKFVIQYLHISETRRSSLTLNVKQNVRSHTRITHAKVYVKMADWLPFFP